MLSTCNLAKNDLDKTVQSYKQLVIAAAVFWKHDYLQNGLPSPFKFSLHFNNKQYEHDNICYSIKLCVERWDSMNQHERIPLIYVHIPKRFPKGI